MLRPPPVGLRLQPTTPSRRRQKSGSDPQRPLSEQESTVGASEQNEDNQQSGQVPTRFSDIINDAAAINGNSKVETPVVGNKSSKSTFKKLFGRSKISKTPSGSSNQTRISSYNSSAGEVGPAETSSSAVLATPTSRVTSTNTPSSRRTVQYRDIDLSNQKVPESLNYLGPRPRSPQGLSLQEFLRSEAGEDPYERRSSAQIAASTSATRELKPSRSYDLRKASANTSEPLPAGDLPSRNVTPQTPSRQHGRYSLFPSTSSPSLRTSQSSTLRVSHDSSGSTPRTPSHESIRPSRKHFNFPPTIPEDEVIDDNITDIPLDVILDAFPDPYDPESVESVQRLSRDSQVFDTAAIDSSRALFSPLPSNSEHINAPKTRKVSFADPPKPRRDATPVLKSATTSNVFSASHAATTARKLSESSDAPDSPTLKHMSSMPSVVRSKKDISSAQNGVEQSQAIRRSKSGDNMSTGEHDRSRAKGQNSEQESYKEVSKHSIPNDQDQQRTEQPREGSSVDIAVEGTVVRDFASRVHSNRGLSVILDSIEDLKTEEEKPTPIDTKVEQRTPAVLQKRPKRTLKLNDFEHGTRSSTSSDIKSPQIASTTEGTQQFAAQKKEQKRKLSNPASGDTELRFVNGEESKEESFQKRIRKMTSIASLASRNRSRSELQSPASPLPEIDANLVEEYDEIDDWLEREKAKITRELDERAAVLYPTRAQAEEEAEVLLAQEYGRILQKGQELLNMHSTDRWVKNKPWNLVNEEEKEALRLAMKHNADKTGHFKKFIISNFGTKRAREELKRDFSTKRELKVLPLHKLRAAASNDAMGLGIEMASEAARPRSKSVSAGWVPRARPTRDFSAAMTAPSLQVEFSQSAAAGRARVVRDAAFFEKIEAASRSKSSGLDPTIPPVPKIPEKYMLPAAGRAGRQGSEASSGPSPSIFAVEPHLDRMIAEGSVSSLSEGRATPTGSIVPEPLFASSKQRAPSDVAAAPPQLGPLRPVSMLSLGFGQRSIAADHDNSAKEVVEGGGPDQTQRPLCSNGGGHEKMGEHGGQDGGDGGCMETCSSCFQMYCPKCIFSCLDVRCVVKTCVVCSPVGACPLHKDMF